MTASALHKFLHHLDILKCDHGGVVELISTVKDRKTMIEEDLRPVCDQDLLRHCYLMQCPTGCKKITAITVGFARDDVLKDEAIPLLGNLQATTDKGGTVTWHSSLSAQVGVGEGYFTKKYIDSVGVPTIGIGFNLLKDNARERIEAVGADYDDILAGKSELTDAQIQTLFQDDMVIAQNSAKNSIPGFDDLSATHQKALTDMTFNLGSFREWPKFVKAVNAGDFKTAAKEAAFSSDGKRPSRWVTQVGNRAKRIIAQIRGDEVYGAPQ